MRHTGGRGARAVLHLEARSQRDPVPGGRAPSPFGERSPVAERAPHPWCGAPAVPQAKARPEGKPGPWDGCADHCGSDASLSQGSPSPRAGAGVLLQAKSSSQRDTVTSHVLYRLRSAVTLWKQRYVCENGTHRAGSAPRTGHVTRRPGSGARKQGGPTGEHGSWRMGTTRSSVRGAARPDRITPNEIPTGPHSSAAPAPSMGPPGSAASWASPPSAHPQLSQAAPFPATGVKPQLTSGNGTGTTTVLPIDRGETAADERTDRPPALLRFLPDTADRGRKTPTGAG